VRIVIPVAVLAAAGIFLLLWWSDDSGGRRTPPPINGDPLPEGKGSGSNGNTTGAELPDVEHIARHRAHEAGTKGEFDRFVAMCAARGADAVPELLRMLEVEDVKLAPRWVVEDGVPQGYPTLRSIYVAALAAIDAPEAADALRTLLDTTESAGESLLAARALADRGESGWSGALLDQASRNPTPVEQPLLKAMVELAARTEPEAAAAHIASKAPRGEDNSDPRALSHGLTVLPLEAATRTTRELLAEAEVTNLAKSRYLRALLTRSEVESLRRMREAALSDEWSDETRIDVANAAAGSIAFFADARAYQGALAAGDTSTADAARARFEERLRAARALIEAALDVPDLYNSDHPRAASLRKRLDSQEKLLGRR
jgi:hypothetical protein